MDLGNLDLDREVLWICSEWGWFYLGLEVRVWDMG